MLENVIAFTSVPYISGKNSDNNDMFNVYLNIARLTCGCLFRSKVSPYLFIHKKLTSKNNSLYTPLL